MLIDVAKQYINTNYIVSTRPMGYSVQTGRPEDSSFLYQTTPPWTVSTSNNSSETSGGGDTLYQNDVDLVKNALGTLAAKSKSVGSKRYWIASRNFSYISSTNWLFEGRVISGSGDLITQVIRGYNKGFIDYKVTDKGIRPIVTFKSDIIIKSGDGKSINTAYKFE